MTSKAQFETTEKRVKMLLRRFAPLSQQVADICSSRDAATKLEREKFDAACLPLNTCANAKLAPLNEQIRPIVEEIERLLAAAVDQDGRALFKTVESHAARAEVKQQTLRQVDPAKLLVFVPEADRTPSFWDCYDVLIGKLSKFLGEEKLEQLAETDYKTPRVSVSRK